MSEPKPKRGRPPVEFGFSGYAGAFWMKRIYAARKAAIPAATGRPAGIGIGENKTVPTRYLALLADIVIDDAATQGRKLTRRDALAIAIKTARTENGLPPTCPPLVLRNAIRADQEHRRKNPA